MPDNDATCDAFIGGLKKDDVQAWGQLTQIVGSQARRYPTVGSFDPEDLAQEALLKIQAAIGGYRPEGKGTLEQNFRAWIHTIVRNTYLTARNQESRSISTSNLVAGLHLSDDWKDGIANDPSAILETLAQRTGVLWGSVSDPEKHAVLKEVIELLDGLGTPRKRLAAGYYYIMGYTIKETAQLLHEHEDAMNTLLMRDVKDDLRKMAQQRGMDARYLALWDRPSFTQPPAVRRGGSQRASTAGEGEADDGTLPDQKD